MNHTKLLLSTWKKPQTSNLPEIKVRNWKITTVCNSRWAWTTPSNAPDGHRHGFGIETIIADNANDSNASNANIIA